MPQAVVLVKPGIILIGLRTLCLYMPYCILQIVRLKYGLQKEGIKAKILSLAGSLKKVYILPVLNKSRPSSL